MAWRAATVTPTAPLASPPATVRPDRGPTAGTTSSRPRRNGGGCNFFWTYDPEVIVAQGGTKYIYYGSYYGGIWAQQLSADGLQSVSTATQITIANRYEGAEVVYRDGYYYLFVSATTAVMAR